MYSGGADLAAGLVAEQGIEPRQPARRHGRGAAFAFGAGQQHAFGAERRDEVVRRQSDAALGLRQAERRAHRPVEPGAGLDRRRPGALVQPAQHQQVGALQARLQRPPDGEPRMAAEAWADDLGLEHGGEQGGPLAAGDGILARPGRAQARQRVGQRFAGIAGPQRVGRSDGLGGGNGGVEQGVRRGASLHEGRQPRCRGLHPVDQLVHGKPVRQVAEARPCRCGRGSPPGPAWASARAGTCDRAGARRRARRRGRRPACTADASAGRAGLRARSARRRRRPAPAAGRRTACRQAACPPKSSMSMFQRLSSAVTRRARLRSGVTRAAVLRSSCRIRRNAKRNDQCLLVRRRAVGARHVLERGSERADPFLGGLGRAHQLGDQQMPRRAVRRPASRRRRAARAPAPSGARAGRTADGSRRAPSSFDRPCRGRGRAARSCPAAGRR